MSADAPPWVVLRREDLEEMLARAVERGRELASDSAWLTADKVAELLDVTRETVISYTRREALPCRYAGKSPVFRRDEVIAWLERRRESPRSQATRHGRSLRGLRGGR
jgi:hypothetical protein